MSTVLLSTCVGVTQSVEIYMGPADLTITNLTTGEFRQVKSSVSITNEESANIVFKHGEVLQLKFTPPEDYKNRKFTVRYNCLNLNIQVSKPPYIYEITIAENIPTGLYVANCSAFCEDWDEISSCKQSIKFSVED